MNFIASAANSTCSNFTSMGSIVCGQVSKRTGALWRCLREEGLHIFLIKGASYSANLPIKATLAGIEFTKMIPLRVQNNPSFAHLFMFTISMVFYKAINALMDAANQQKKKPLHIIVRIYQYGAFLACGSIAFPLSSKCTFREKIAVSVGVAVFSSLLYDMNKKAQVAFNEMENETKQKWVEINKKCDEYVSIIKNLTAKILGTASESLTNTIYRGTTLVEIAGRASAVVDQILLLMNEMENKNDKMMNDKMMNDNLNLCKEINELKIKCEYLENKINEKKEVSKLRKTELAELKAVLEEQKNKNEFQDRGEEQFKIINNKIEINEQNQDEQKGGLLNTDIKEEVINEGINYDENPVNQNNREKGSTLKERIDQHEKNDEVNNSSDKINKDGDDKCSQDDLNEQKPDDLKNENNLFAKENQDNSKIEEDLKNENNQNELVDDNHENSKQKNQAQELEIES